MFKFTIYKILGVRVGERGLPNVISANGMGRKGGVAILFSKFSETLVQIYYTKDLW